MKKHLKESEPRSSSSSSRVAEESALHQLCYIRTRFVSLHFDPFSVFTLEHFCHIPGDIFNCVILSKYFFSCLLLFCFVVIKFHFYGIRRLNVIKKRKDNHYFVLLILIERNSGRVLMMCINI